MLVAPQAAMKITSTLVVLAVGGALMGAASLSPVWSPIAALLLPCTGLGAFAAWLIENQDGVERQEMKKAA